MARPTEFDRSAARDKALVLFWNKGYQAASLAELLDVMGIGRGSFYAAFTDKRSLYVECLDLFSERTQAVLQDARQRMGGLDALQCFFERNFTGRRLAQGRLGCMLVNTVLEMSGVDDDLAQRASQHLAAMEQLFELSLIDAGLGHEAAREMAAMLMLLNEGIRVSSRRELPAQTQLASIRTTFGLIRQAHPHHRRTA